MGLLTEVNTSPIYGAYLNSLVVDRQEAVRLMQGFLPLNPGSAGSGTSKR